jgi:hypothetical protein
MRSNKNIVYEWMTTNGTTLTYFNLELIHLKCSEKYSVTVLARQTFA